MSIAFENILFELIRFVAFISICTGLLKFRYTKTRSALILAASVAVAAVIQVIIFLIAPNATELILTLLPITVYLPVIIAIHILAKGGFAAAVAAWSMGLLAPYILSLFRELFRIMWARKEVPVSYMHPMLLGSLVLGALLVFVSLRFCRKPFQMYEFRDKYVWLIIPVVLLCLLVSYLENMLLEPFVTFLSLSIVLVMFGFLIKFLNVAMSESIAEASEREIARQLDAQRQELFRINQKMEQTRIYRHDMRHHLSVLHNLAENEKTEDMREYISSLDAQISDLEKEKYCDNTAANAVLSTYIGKAKQEDIRIEVAVDIPKELPIDTFDICTVLSNALSNAVNGCRSSRKERWICISSALHENGNFSVDIRNSCETPVEFGRDGFPVSHGGEEHGFGIKSIDSIVKKYNGLLRCTCDGGVFRLSAVLFSPDNSMPAAKPFSIKKVASNAAVSLLLAICFLNFMPGTMQSAAAAPAVGNVIRMLDIRTYRSFFSWGSNELQVSVPQVSSDPRLPDAPADPSSPDLSNGIHEMDRQIEEYIEEAKSRFFYYFSRKYRGYVASDTDYTVLRNDEYLLVIQFYTSLNMGGSATYSRCFTLDKTSGSILGLSDLFTEGSDYVGVLSAEILRQMEERVAAGQADYFIPGGIFPEDECFQRIDADQNFYIDESNRLVIVFDEYEVASGSAGTPKFTIESKILQDILRQPSMLSQVGKETA